VVGEKDPSGEVKRVQCPRSVEGSRQEGEIRLSEFLSSPQQAHDDEEISIGKKSTPEFRHRDRIRHGGDNSYGKDADRKTGGPRYLLATPVPAGSQPVGASIPVTRECSMTVLANGPVTQKGIDQLMAYLKLVRDSFPEN
jgi:hypothetical protein